MRWIRLIRRYGYWRKCVIECVLGSLKAHARPKLFLFLLPADQDIGLLATSLVPYLFACCHALHHNNRLTYETVGKLSFIRVTLHVVSLCSNRTMTKMDINYTEVIFSMSQEKLYLSWKMVLHDRNIVTRTSRK